MSVKVNLYMRDGRVVTGWFKEIYGQSYSERPWHLKADIDMFPHVFVRDVKDIVAIQKLEEKS